LNAVDLAGHGHTPPEVEGADVSPTGLAHRVLELVDQRGLKRFDLAANYTGGAVAQAVAAHAGDRLSRWFGLFVARVVVVGSAAESSLVAT
jgi:pimeloyl-ACP methyl ester carboxylesterase